MNKLFLPLLFCSCSLFPMQQMCNVKGLNKIEVLQALFADAKPKIGVEYDKNYQLTEHDTAAIVHSKMNPCSVDYLHGRCMHIEFMGDYINTKFYNYVNGVDAAERAIQMLRLKAILRIVKTGGFNLLHLFQKEDDVNLHENH